MKKKSLLTTRLSQSLILLMMGNLASGSLSADTIKVTVENLSPAEGTILTPFWVGFHSGGFDLFDAGSAASAGVEAIAEDGNVGPAREAFASAQSEGIDSVITGPANPNGPPLFFPGSTSTMRFDLDSSNPYHRYMSFASMILPSNDAFIGNDDAMGIPVFDENGEFVGGTYIVLGLDVYDAGTEVNDETPENVPVLGQMAPNTGTPENGVVSMHPGFLPDGNVLASFPNANFLAEGYTVARITIEKLEAKPRYLNVTVQNLAPESGTILTPFWLGLHDGSFDLFNTGEAASAGVERVAEDGDVAVLQTAFSDASASFNQTVLTGPNNPDGPPLFFQGTQNTAMLHVDANSPSSSYLSFISMILPSNDAFIGNGDPTAYRIYDEYGNFNPLEVVIKGSQVYDAGTEVNDEIATNVPVLGQMTPDTGVVENGVVAAHPGFLQNGNVLASFPAADFVQEAYIVAKITVREVYNPFSGLEVGENGYKESEFFGLIDDAAFPWVRHAEHGWLYIYAKPSNAGFWAYNIKDDLGWIYTTPDAYPVLMSASLGTYLYYREGSVDPREFFDYSEGIWITVP